MKSLLAFLKDYFSRSDKWLLVFVISASAYSVVLLAGLVNSQLATGRTLIVQAAASLIGLLAALIIARIDYRTMAKLWKLHVPLALGLVLLTFFIGVQRAELIDDKAWLLLPFGLSLQPSEILKISFILSFAYHLELVKEHLNSLLNVMLLTIHGAVPVLLVHYQGDDGSALIFVVIFVLMFVAAGLAWKYILAALGMAAVAAPLMWVFVMNYDQKLRIISMFNPEMYVESTYYQQYNAKISIGSGLMTGKGLFNGTHRYVPEIHNDFIFSFVGEALGFIGCMLVIVLLIAICLKVLFNSRRALDTLGFNICVGVFAMIASQSIINIGMNLSLLPVVGITLPFFSAGGSSVVALYCSIGLVLSVYMHSYKGLFSN